VDKTPQEHPDPAADADPVPRGLRIGAAYTWRLLVIGAALAVVAAVARLLAEIVVPLLVGVILSALLVPLAALLQRHRWPKWLAILVTWVIALGVLGGLALLVTEQVLSQLPRLQQQIGASADSMKSLLASHPFGLTEGRVQGWLSEAVGWLQAHAAAVGLHALAAGKRVVQLLEGAFIMLFVTLFAMIDGPKIWAWTTRLFPRRARDRIDAAGRAGWHTLTEFARIQILVAAVDAIGIGIGAWILGVPLVLPIMVIVFFGALIPIIGSIVAGAAAVAIALLFNGWPDALIMLGVVLLVNQLEGNVLHPFLTGGAVHVHPLAIVLGVTAGAAIGGIAGAFFAVPLIATINAMVIAAAHYAPAARAEQGPDPPAGEG
jgi:predicted PurR-regulated permease PerM